MDNGSNTYKKIYIINRPYWNLDIEMVGRQYEKKKIINRPYWNLDDYSQRLKIL